MEFKRFIVNTLTVFFMLSTLITVAASLIGSAFDKNAQLGYSDLLIPVLYAALCTLPALVLYSKRELSPKALLVRKAIMLVLVEAVMMGIVFTSDVIDHGRIEVVLAIAGSVLVIFVLVNLFTWLKGSVEARRLNKDLEQFQKLHGQNADRSV